MAIFSNVTKIFSGFYNGLSKFPKALGFMFKHRLIWFFAFPVLLNILFWVIGFELVSQLSDFIMAYALEILTEFDFGLDQDGWVYKGIYGVLWLSFRILYFILFAYLGGYVILLFLSPILNVLSQKVEERSSGKSFPFSILNFLNDVMRSIAITVRNFMLELLFIGGFLLLSLIPPLGLFLPFALFFVSAYYYGFAMMDYSLERQNYGIPKSIKFMRKNTGSTMAIGIPMALVLLIPFVGSLLAGFVAIISVVAGNLESLELISQNNSDKK